jgi:hypothetical protein
VARIVLGSYMVRYPLAGMMSSALQWLVACDRLGHEVYLVEKSGWASSCFDPSRKVMTDDCSYGTKVVDALLSRFGLGGRWCYLAADGRYHGLPKESIEAVLASADVFLDYGSHGAWNEEAAGCDLRVLIDGEPAFTQMKMELKLAAGEEVPTYDRYYTLGANIGTDRASSPTAGRAWKWVVHPVNPDLFQPAEPPPDGAFTTVMNWRAHDPIRWGGKVYGQKDVEFAKFLDLPKRVPVPVEVAVSGKDVPRNALTEHGWSLRDAHAVTKTFDAYRRYMQASKGELGVAKNVFVATNSGWFGDRSAAYLATGRPVVLQDTGFSQHLPCGEGLFAVKDVEEAAWAIEEVTGSYMRHSKRAREIAAEHLEAKQVVGRFLGELGL